MDICDIFNCNRNYNMDIDDRGSNDIERMSEEKDKVIINLKQDNKLLAKQVEDLLEQKKQLLDNVSKK